MSGDSVEARPRGSSTPLCRHRRRHLDTAAGCWGNTGQSPLPVLSPCGRSQRTFSKCSVGVGPTEAPQPAWAVQCWCLHCRPPVLAASLRLRASGQQAAVTLLCPGPGRVCMQNQHLHCLCGLLLARQEHVPRCGARLPPIAQCCPSPSPSLPQLTPSEPQLAALYQLPLNVSLRGSELCSASKCEASKHCAEGY